MKGPAEAAGAPRSARTALKKNTFIPAEPSVRTALGSLYLYTPQGALPRKVALKAAASGGRREPLNSIQVTKGADVYLMRHGSALA